MDFTFHHCILKCQVWAGIQGLQLMATAHNIDQDPENGEKQSIRMLNRYLRFLNKK